jgi:hypothetical protein
VAVILACRGYVIDQIISVNSGGKILLIKQTVARLMQVNLRNSLAQVHSAPTQLRHIRVLIH